MIHSFDTDIAEKYGINCALILTNLYFWTVKNRANEVNFYDGRYWTYNSKRALTRLFPYLTERQIDYAIKQLIENELLITGNYNKSTYDRTLWYALTDKAFYILHDCEVQSTSLLNGEMQNCEMHSTNLLNGLNNSVEPIPDIKTDIKNTSYSTNNQSNIIDITNIDSIDNSLDSQKSTIKDTESTVLEEHHIEKKSETEKKGVKANIKISFVKGLEPKKEPRTKEEIMIANLQKSLDNISKGKELKDALKNWVAILVKNKGGIQTEQIKLALEELESITKDETRQLAIVKEASQLGYLKFKWVKLEEPEVNSMCNPENHLPSFDEIVERDRKRFEEERKSGKYKEPEKKFDEKGRRYF